MNHEGEAQRPARPMERLVRRQCWYDGNPATEVWRTTWDEDANGWPMCAECAAAVRVRLALREQGRHADADKGDDSHGIATRGLAGRWIPPNVFLSPRHGAAGKSADV